MGLRTPLFEWLKVKFKRSLAYLPFVFLLLLIVSLVRNAAKVMEAKERIRGQEKKVVKLKEENESLKEKLREVESPEFIEKGIREKLGLVKEGETLVVLPEEEVLRKVAPQTAKEEDSLPVPNWKKWVKLFF